MEAGPDGHQHGDDAAVLPIFSRSQECRRVSVWLLSSFKQLAADAPLWSLQEAVPADTTLLCLKERWCKQLKVDPERIILALPDGIIPELDAPVSRLSNPLAAEGLRVLLMNTKVGLPRS